MKSSLAFRFIVLSIACGAMVTGTTAFASALVGQQDQFHGVPAKSVTRFASCSGAQFKKCVDYCVKRNIANYGSVDVSKCKQYCRENASSQNGCP